MNDILNYIFYRIYISYRRKNDPPKFSTILYLVCSLMFLLMPIAGIFLEAMRNENEELPIIYFILYLASVFTFVLIKYRDDDKIAGLIDKYYYDKMNKAIPSWVFFMILPFSMVFGLGGFILMSKYFIIPYNIRGVAYDYLLTFL